MSALMNALSIRVGRHEHESNDYIFKLAGSIAQSTARLTANPGVMNSSPIEYENIIILPLPLIAKRQLSVTGKCTSIHALSTGRLEGLNLLTNSVSRLTDRLDMTLIVLAVP